MKILLPLLVLGVTIFLLRQEPLASSAGAEQETAHSESATEIKRVELIPTQLLPGKYTELTGRINDLILFNQ